MTLLSAGGALVSCQTAYTNNLSSGMTTEVASGLTRVARILSPQSTPANANAQLAAMLPAAEGLIMTASASAADSIKQRMMINVMNNTSSSLAQILDDPASAQTELGASMASASANSAYRITAKLASETLPIIRNAIELVILGVFPIMLIIIIIAGTKGGMVLRSYVMTMLWLQLWAPLYAIVNFVGTMAHANSAKAALEGIDGVAIANAAAFTNATISSEAVVGILTITVPMLALALVKGGEIAMSGVVSSVTGGASSAASRAGEAVGTGNISLGNTSWGNGQYNNTQANKTNTDGQIFNGAMETRQGADVLKDFQGGRSTLAAGQNSSPITSTNGVAADTSLTEKASKTLSTARSEAVQSGDLSLASLNNSTNFAKNADDSTRVSDTIGQTARFGKTNTHGERNESKTTAGATSSQNNTNKTTASADARLGTGKGGPASPGQTATPDAKPESKSSGISYAGETPASPPKPSIGERALGKLGALKEAFKAVGFNAGLVKDYNEAYGRLREYGTAEQMSKGAALNYEVAGMAQRAHEQTNSQSGGTTTGTGVSAQLQHAKSHLATAQANLSEAQDLTQQASRTLKESQGLNYNAASQQDGRQQLAQLEKWRGMTPEQIRNDMKSEGSGGIKPMAMPKELLDGGEVPTKGSIGQQYGENKGQIPNTAAGDYAGFAKRVPGGGAGGKEQAGADPNAAKNFEAGRAFSQDFAERTYAGQQYKFTSFALKTQGDMAFLGYDATQASFSNPLSFNPSTMNVLRNAATDTAAPIMAALGEAGVPVRPATLNLGAGSDQPQVGVQDTSFRNQATKFFDVERLQESSDQKK